jgi:hypothetical protein
MKLSNIIYFLLITLLITGCGGGGGGQASLDESADGIWIGPSFNEKSDKSDITSLFYGGKYATINTANKELYSGSYTIEKDVITSEDSKSFKWDGTKLASGSILGKVNSQSVIELTFTEDLSNSDVNNPQVRNDYNMYERELSEKNLNNNLLKGSWTTKTPFESSSVDEPLYVFALQNDKLSVVNSINCFIEGELKIPKGNLNIFEFTLTISGSACNFNGDYSGLGYSDTKWIEKEDSNDVKIDVEVDMLTFAYSNDDFGFVFETYRLSP